MTCAAIFLVGCVVTGSALSIVMLVMATASFGACSSNMWAILRPWLGRKPLDAGRDSKTALEIWLE